MNNGYSWSDAFESLPGVQASWRLAPGPDEFLVEQLSSSDLSYRGWPLSPLGPAVQAWAFLDGGVHAIQGFGGGLANGVRVIGWTAMRWVSFGLRLDPPPDPLPGEDSVVTFDELKAVFQAGDRAISQGRADLLSGVQDAPALRQFIQRTLGDRGLSGPRGPNYPAAGEWGQRGFTAAAASLLKGHLTPEEADQRAAAYRSHYPPIESDPIAHRMALQSELVAIDETVARTILARLDGAPPPAPRNRVEHVPVEWPDPLALPFALSWDVDWERLAEPEDDDDIEHLDELREHAVASYKWSNDTGMPSWQGGGSLVPIGGGKAVLIGDGDETGLSEPIDFPDDVDAQATTLIEQVCCAYPGFTALELEPFDPHDTLSMDRQAEWSAALRASGSSVDLSAGDDVAARIRELLREVPVYARVRGAMADPMSTEGQLLLEAIRATAFHGGATAFLESGEWENLAL